jgi:hypothetical protein
MGASRMINPKRVACIGLSLTLIVGIFPYPSNANGIPSALVEDVSATQTKIELMDYLSPGQTIDLANGEYLMLSYFASCVAETITGGTVIIGMDKSEISGGTIESEWIDCDGGAVDLAASQQQEAGAVVFRASEDPTKLPVPDRVIYGQSPLIKLSAGPAAITITRLDAEEPAIQLAAGSSMVDTARSGIRLSPDATYAIQTSMRTMIVKVSRSATETTPTALSRLVPM